MIMGINTQKKPSMRVQERKDDRISHVLNAMYFVMTLKETWLNIIANVKDCLTLKLTLKTCGVYKAT